MSNHDAPAAFKMPCPDCAFTVDVVDGKVQPHKCGDLLLRDNAYERGTRVFFGRQYHWVFDVRENRLSLRHGADPAEMLRS